MTDKDMLAGMVKPLEWVNDGIMAKCALGTYRVVDFGSHWNIDRFDLSVSGRDVGRYPTIEAAQSAAQADYTARILAALNPDAVLALVAAAYADAAKQCDRRAGNAADFNHAYRRSASMCAADIRALTPATAALAKMLADAQAEGLEMAAEYCNGDEPGDFWPNLRAGIRAMKGEGA